MKSLAICKSANNCPINDANRADVMDHNEAEEDGRWESGEKQGTLLHVTVIHYTAVHYTRDCCALHGTSY